MHLWECFTFLVFLNDFVFVDFAPGYSTVIQRIASPSVDLCPPPTAAGFLSQPLTTRSRSLARLAVSAPPATVSVSLDLSWVASSCCIIRRKSRSSKLWRGAYSLWSLCARSLHPSRPSTRALWTFCRTFISNLGLVSFWNRMSGCENSNACRNYN